MEKKCVVQNVTQLLLLRHGGEEYTIFLKPFHVISHRHLTEGTGAPEAGLILQRSMGGMYKALVSEPMIGQRLNGRT